jgi:plastocyanin
MRKATVAILIALSACGGGDSGGDPNPDGPTIAKASASSGDGQTGTVAQPLTDSFRVVVREGGSPRSGVTVTWSSSIASAIFNPASSVTDASGRAASRMTLARVAGGQTARASLDANNFVTFNVSGIPGPPSKLTIFSGNGQASLANDALALPLQVKVSDQFDNPIVNSMVDWSVVSGIANLSTGTSQTSAGGLASVSVTAGAGGGAIQVRAISAGQDTVIFDAHVVTLVKDILVKNNFFESVSNGSQAPSVDTIPAGEAVRFVWQSADVEHNVVPQGSPVFQGISGAIRSPFTYGPVRIANPGTYNYDCNLHAGMSGVIVVE